MKQPQLFTPREVLFGISAIMCLALYIGCIANHFAGSWPSWEALDASGSVLGAIFTAIAVWLAWKGFKQSREQQRQEYRPYIRIELTELTVEPGQPIKLRLVPSNYGRSFARNLRFKAQVAYIPAATDMDAFPQELVDVSNHMMTIHPNMDPIKQFIEASAALVLSEREIAAVGADMTLLIRAACSYEDALNETYETRIAVYVYEQRGPDFAMRHTKKGEWAT